MLRLLCALACLLLPLRAGAADLEKLQREIVLTHAQIVHASYTDALLGAKALQTAVRDFLAAPDDAKLAAARAAWVKARQPYLQTEVYRFYGGPIDDEDGVEPLLNSWPLDEQYIDAADGGDGGIIGNERAWPEITPSVLESLNLQDGEKNIACGWHAIEFLLWGQDTNPAGPGNRSVSDFTTAMHAKRRGQYLQAACDLLVSHLESLTREWEPGKLGNFRAVFEEGVVYSIERILYGMIFFSGVELGGERLQVAWDTQEQEEEHSCFSDTTCQDLLYDVRGMENVWLGRYVRTDGTSITGKGLRDLCAAVKADELGNLDNLLSQLQKSATAIPPPFDQAIIGKDDSPGRIAVLGVISRAQDIDARLRLVARTIQIEIPEVPPEDLEK